MQSVHEVLRHTYPTLYRKMAITANGSHLIAKNHLLKSRTTKMIDQEKVNFTQLKNQVSPYLLSLLRQLLPNGKLANREYVALNPTRCDKHLGSFRINIFTGKWADFATGDKGGDLISLWAYVNGTGQIDAARALQAIVGGV